MNFPHRSGPSACAGSNPRLADEGSTRGVVTERQNVPRHHCGYLERGAEVGYGGRSSYARRDEYNRGKPYVASSSAPLFRFI